MARGQVVVRLDGLAKARERIKGLNKRSTDKSISKNVLRIGGGYNIKQCPVDTSALLRSFKMEIRRKFLRLKWGGGQVTYAAIVNQRGSSAGYAEAIARNTARDIAAYASTGRKPRLRAARRFGNNRNSA